MRNLSILDTIWTGLSDQIIEVTLFQSFLIREVPLYCSADAVKPVILFNTYLCYLILLIKVAKTFPYHPDNTSFDPENSLSDEDIQFLQEYGFNVVRLYVAWPGVEPKKDQYNITYLNVSTVELTSNKGRGYNRNNLSTKDMLQDPKCFLPIKLLRIHFESLKSRQPLYK